ncbi:MAG: ABC transporter ATP-binding protein [Actinomycetota bacterium]
MTTVSGEHGGALVAADGVTKRYGSFTVLTGVNFIIGGGITGLLGANGTGKTTLLGMMLGLHQTDGGSLRVLGIDPYSAGAEVRARLGYAPEHHTLPPDVKASDFVRHVAELHGLPKREATTRASDALWLVGLGEERFRPLGTMSTGQRQRVKLAQAIAHDPSLVLLDEPTDGLDPVQRDDMLVLIRRVATEYGIDVVLSSHLLDEVQQICDGAVIIGDGRVLASGSLEELRGGGSDIVVELEDAATVQPVVAGLQARDIAVTVDGRLLVATGQDDRVFDIARDVCANAGAGITRLSRRRLSLEDVFLETTS